MTWASRIALPLLIDLPLLHYTAHITISQRNEHTSVPRDGGDFFQPVQGQMTWASRIALPLLIDLPLLHYTAHITISQRNEHTSVPRGGDFFQPVQGVSALPEQVRPTNMIRPSTLLSTGTGQV